jgi:hypothetical protein
MKLADSEAAAREQANDRRGGAEETIESMLPPLAEPLDEAFAVVAGATYCYKWSCDASRCPDFHQQDSTPPMVVYNMDARGFNWRRARRRDMGVAPRPESHSR